MKKKVIKPVSEKRFRLLLLLTALLILLSVFSIVDGLELAILPSLMAIFITSITSPDKYLEIITNSPLAKWGLPLAIASCLCFAGYIFLSSANHLLLAALAYLLFAIIFFVFGLQQTSKARVKNNH